jgi:osmotically-inducible protein OsmY
MPDSLAHRRGGIMRFPLRRAAIIHDAGLEAWIMRRFEWGTVVLMVMSAAGCGDRPPAPPQVADQARQDALEARRDANEARRDASEAVEEARREVNQAARETREAAREDRQAARQPPEAPAGETAGEKVAGGFENAGQQIGTAVDRAGKKLESLSIEAKISGKYALDDLIKAYRIDIDERDGVVTLSGTVGSTEAKERAVRLARETGGVRQVIDHLQVQQ